MYKRQLFLLPISERVLGCKRINISVYDYQETFVLGKGKIVGVYDNNTIGAVYNNYGRGKVFLFGSFVGYAYEKTGNVSRSLYRLFMTEPDPKIRSLIASPCQIANVSNPVTVSEPLVEATLIESEKGIVIPLINYTTKEVDPKPIEITVTIKNPGKITSIESIGEGGKEEKLKYKKVKDGIEVNLPLKVTKMIVIRH